MQPSNHPTRILPEQDNSPTSCSLAENPIEPMEQNSWPLMLCPTGHKRLCVLIPEGISATTATAITAVQSEPSPSGCSGQTQSCGRRAASTQPSAALMSTQGHFAYLMVTGVKRSTVVTLSRKAERTAATRHSMKIMVHTLPRDNWYAWNAIKNKLGSMGPENRCNFSLGTLRTKVLNKHYMAD